METGVLTYAYNPGLNIGWNIGMGLGFDLSNYKKKNNINTKRCGKSKETVWWACMAFNYSSATIDRINISTITGGFQVSYLDRIVAGVDLGSIHATGSYFLFRPLIGYEFKSLRCAIAPSLKLYFDLSNYKNEKTGFMLTMRLY